MESSPAKMATSAPYVYKLQNHCLENLGVTSWGFVNYTVYDLDLNVFNNRSIPISFFFLRQCKN